MNRHKQLFGALGRRSMACLLALILVLGLVPVTSLRASAISVDEAVQKVVDWGFMRGDISGNMRPDDPITRAEFVTIINRAFGYHVMGEDPFTDVTNADWYAQDVAIAYTENYINGTSASTFSPNGHLTREQAVVILARNMRLQAYPGEDTSFSDSRDLHEWSRGLVEQAVRYHIVNGYPDGTFRPDRAITRGEAATLLVNAIGNPVQEAGSQSLSGVYGNVTITASGVTLRDTVVAGNLYITDGVDLGSVLLENVRVLGQIVICGGGVSQDGNDSIVLRNVDAQELIIDTQRGQEVSVRVDGDGTIASTTVRTNAFLRDNTGDGQGMLKITLDGGEKAKLSLAGNIKQVTNLTPGSTMNLVSGTASSITIDEAATGSTLDIAAGALADEVNLDVATTVTGQGDIGKLTVNTSGSTVTMLPDQIVVRPGDTVTIGGETMDSTAAAEASSDPRLMGGYPNVSDLAPTSALAKFSGNKAGTVYWAVTPITAGSVGAGDLINPPSYNNNIVKSGTTSLTGSGVVASTKLDKLTSGGSYYLSAVFVDARQDQSPVKVISFSTPDDTVPAFADGYPYLSRITNISAQVTVMPTKTCQLYYALLPKGASAPTEDNFKAGSGAIPGNLGYGSIPVTKNTTYSFDVNNVPLEELESYDLYLWLSDLEGGKSSAVKKLNFTTVDRTAPKFNVEATVNNIQATSVGLYANLNEDGTLYWAIVAEGETYPKPLAGTDPDSTVDLSSDNAKLQVVSGMNALKYGKVTMTANKDISFTISGLDKEKSYDLYYVAQDKAGNYSDTVKKITIHTLDQSGPTVTQEFTRYNANDPTHPLPDTDIRIVFSEPVMDQESLSKYSDLYEAVLTAEEGAEKDGAREALAAVLSKNILLYEKVDGIEEQVVDRAQDKTATDWTIDYRFAEVSIEEGKMVVTFPSEEDLTQSALNLKSGATYYFKIDGVADTSSAQNPMGVKKLEEFTTVFAQVNLSSSGNTTEMINDTHPVDAYWRLSPVSTQNVAESIKWDMIIWSDTTVQFTLWSRASTENGGWTPWEQVKADNTSGLAQITVDYISAFSGISMSMNTNLLNKNGSFNPLKDLEEGTVYEYAVSFTKVLGDSERNNWSGTVNMNINVVAGEQSSLKSLAANVSEENWSAQVGNGVTNIGQPETLNLHVPFQDKTAPSFVNGYPQFSAGDSIVNMDLMLNRQGTVYYVLAPAGDIATVGGKIDSEIKDTSYGQSNWDQLPEDGENEKDLVIATMPDYNSIVNAREIYVNSKNVKYGSLSVGQAVTVEKVEGLLPERNYIAYFVTRGTAQVYSDVYCYRFATSNVETPILNMQNDNAIVNFQTSLNSNVSYVLFAPNELPALFERTVTYDGGKQITVLNAILQSDSSGRSILDTMKETVTLSPLTGSGDEEQMTAEELREQVRDYIERSIGSGGNATASGKKQTEAKEWVPVDFTDSMKNESVTNYYCLAVAQNVLGGGYAYKGVSNVHIKDTEPPALISYTTSVYPGGSSEVGYSGQLTLTFDDFLYFLQKDAMKAIPVYNTTDDTPGLGGTLTAISFVKHLGGSANVTPLTTSSTISNTFALQFHQTLPGATIVIFSDGFVSDSSANSTKEFITLKLQEKIITGVGDFNIKTAEWVLVE